MLVIAVAALAVKLAGPVLDAVGELVHVFLIVAAGILGVGAASLVGLLTWRWRRPRPDAARAMPPTLMARAAQPLPEPQRSAAALPPPEGPREIHLHLHGVTAEDVAEILDRHKE